MFETFYAASHTNKQGYVAGLLTIRVRIQEIQIAWRKHREEFSDALIRAMQD
jgi:hypothetical protein